MDPVAGKFIKASGSARHPILLTLVVVTNSLAALRSVGPIAGSEARSCVDCTENASVAERLHRHLVIAVAVARLSANVCKPEERHEPLAAAKPVPVLL